MFDTHKPVLYTIDDRRSQSAADSPDLDNGIGQTNSDTCVSLCKLTLSVEETAHLLGVSKAMVYRMVKNKELPHLNIGKRIVIHRPSLESWLAEQSSQNVQ